MGTPWDRAAAKYLEEWVPRFVPYHLDLVQELVLTQAQRVLVVTAGPGAEVLAVARAVGDKGVVRATDPSDELVSMCAKQVQNAGFGYVTCDRAEPDDVGVGGWNAIICAFGMWKGNDRVGMLKSWAGALVPTGKIGLLIFGPPDPNDPFEMLADALRAVEPDAMATPARVPSDRESLTRMFEDAGLALVRHTLLRHTLTFPSGEAFIAAIREGRTWRRVWQELGEERMNLVTARFYDRIGGPMEPMSFEPAVTCAIAALPGAQVELATRHSVKVPALSSSSVVPAPPSSKVLADKDPYKDDPFRD